jgi:D-alanyl-D-alanine carboxypeptidase
MRRIKNKKVLATIFISVLLLIIIGLAWPSSNIKPNNVSSVNPSPIAKVLPAPAFNKDQYPPDVSSSLWVVVNKGRALPASYVPASLVVPNIPLRQSAAGPAMQVRADTAAALEAMITQASGEGVSLMLTSGYRSYNDQVAVHQGYAQSQGSAAADTFSARAGHSEHQTGLAADLEPTNHTCELDQCFETTPEGQWLAANCYKFGFIIRYQKNTTNLTGYEYEPWHVRYVGKDLAAQLQTSNQTLEQFFDLPTYTDYPASSLTLKI